MQQRDLSDRIYTGRVVQAITLHMCRNWRPPITPVLSNSLAGWSLGLRVELLYALTMLSLTMLSLTMHSLTMHSLTMLSLTMLSLTMP